MSRGVNKVILVGTLGKDPEVRYSQAGAAMASISVATNESWKDKVTGEKQERTEWHRVKFFGRLAEIAGEYLTKGGKVYIEGSLRTEKYTDKNGVEKYSTDIIAQEMQMLSSPQDGGDRDRDDGRGRSTGNNRGRDDDQRSSSRGQARREASPPRGRSSSRDDDDDRPPSRSVSSPSDRGYVTRGEVAARQQEPRHDEPFPDDDIPF